MNSGTIFFVYKIFSKQNKNATRIQNILTHSVWASVWLFLTFATIKVVGEPQQQILILATIFVKRTGCLQPSYTTPMTVKTSNKKPWVQDSQIFKTNMAPISNKGPVLKEDFGSVFFHLHQRLAKKREDIYYLLFVGFVCWKFML